MLTDDQKEQRLSYVTGSDASIICGLSPYTTPYELWEQKTRRAVAPDISHKPAVKAGIMLEGAIRDWLGEELGKEIYDDPMIISEEHPFMAANIDGHVNEATSENGEYEIVEIKTTSSPEGWGDVGSNIIPRNYLLQVVHYMAVCNAYRCYVAVLIRGVDFRHYVLERDFVLEEMLIQKEKQFWSCVQLDIPPGPVYNKDLIDYLDEREGVVMSKKDFKEMEKIFK